MSRLWSRFGVRTLAVVLLASGTVGGVYLSDSRAEQEQGIQARRVAQAETIEHRMMKQHLALGSVEAGKRWAAEEEQRRAEAARRAAAERAARKKAEAAAKKKAAEEKKLPLLDIGPIPESCAEFKGNRAKGCAMVLAKGWDLKEFACLNKLWNRESGWNHKAYNSGSGAYGIPQALPGSKMASAGENWKNDPAVQIKWGLGYIKGRYDSPCGAWSSSESRGWY